MSLPQLRVGLRALILLRRREKSAALAANTALWLILAKVVYFAARLRRAGSQHGALTALWLICGTVAPPAPISGETFIPEAYGEKMTPALAQLVGQYRHSTLYYLRFQA